jgi:hypothetical protein
VLNVVHYRQTRLSQVPKACCRLYLPICLYLPSAGSIKMQLATRKVGKKLIFEKKKKLTAKKFVSCRIFTKNVKKTTTLRERQHTRALTYSRRRYRSRGKLCGSRRSSYSQCQIDGISHRRSLNCFNSKQRGEVKGERNRYRMENFHVAH